MESVEAHSGDKALVMESELAAAVAAVTAAGHARIYNFLSPDVCMCFQICRESCSLVVSAHPSLAEVLQSCSATATPIDLGQSVTFLRLVALDCAYREDGRMCILL